MKQNFQSSHCLASQKCPQCGFGNVVALYARSVSIGTQCTELDFPSLEPLQPSLSPTLGHYVGIKRKMMDAYETHKKKEIKLSPEASQSPEYVPTWLLAESKPPEVASPASPLLNAPPTTSVVQKKSNRPSNMRLALLDCGLPTIDYSAISSGSTAAVRGPAPRVSHEKALDLSPVTRTSAVPLLVQAVVIDTKQLAATPYFFSQASLCSPEYDIRSSFTVPPGRNKGSYSPNNTGVTSVVPNDNASYKVTSPSLSQSDTLNMSPLPESTDQPPSGETWEHESPVHEAVYRGDVARLTRECQQKNADINTKDNNGETPLHTAVKMHHSDMLRVLITYGASVAAKDRQGNNVLHLIAQAGHVACLDALVSVGSAALSPKTINALNDEGYAPLHVAVRNKRTEVIAALTHLGALVNLPDGRSGRTALFHAVALNLPQLALQLMDFGAKTNCADFSGTTPLAAAHGINKQIATLLMSKNAKMRNQQS